MQHRVRNMHRWGAPVVEYVLLTGGIALAVVPAAQRLTRSLEGAFSTSQALASPIYGPHSRAGAAPLTGGGTAVAQAAASGLAPAPTGSSAGANPAGANPASTLGAPPSGAGATSPSTSAGPPALPGVSPVQQTVAQPLRLRGTPGGSPTLTLAAGEAVEVVEVSSDDRWHRVRLADGRGGWVAAAELPLPPVPRGAVRLSLTDSQAGLTHYEVHYGKSSGHYPDCQRFAPDLRLVLITGLEPGTNYFFVVKAAIGAAVSPPTKEVSKTAATGAEDVS